MEYKERANSEGKQEQGRKMRQREGKGNRKRQQDNDPELSSGSRIAELPPVLGV